MSNVQLLTIFSFLMTCPAVSWGKVSCLDNDGKPVDWFIVYKLPHISQSKHETIQNGVGQIYMDVNNQHWKLLDNAITDSSGHAVYHTLQQVYEGQRNDDIAYLMYNDEPPVSRKSSNHGHTKGDICFDKSSGFWLVHSVPKFPPIPSDGYSYPKSGTVFGQTFLCVSYMYSTLNAIGKQLLYNYPKFYAHQLPDDFVDDNMNVSNAIEGSHVKTQPWTNRITLTSSAGQEFISFAKFTEYGRDLYDAWLAPYFASSMDVETWHNGVGPLPSNCSHRYNVLNVEELKLLDESFTRGKDHAKWAVTVDKQWICIGDINREVWQSVAPLPDNVPRHRVFAAL